MLASFVFLSTLAFANSDDDRFHRAQYLLEVQRLPRDAMALFETLATDETLPRQLRARSRLGWGRCAILLGRPEEATAQLTLLRRRFSQWPALSRRLEIELARSARPTTSYLEGVRRLGPGQALDLDAGAVLEGRGQELERSRDQDAPRIVAEAVEDPSFALQLDSLSSRPWSRVTTDLGRQAWIQILGQDVVRFVTEMGSGDAVYSAPKLVASGGTRRGIEIHFRSEDRYAFHRLERRDPGATHFVEIARVDPPFALDSSVDSQTIYTYRLTGVTPMGDESLPRIFRASTRHWGVHKGRVPLSTNAADRSFDLATERRSAVLADVNISAWTGRDSLRITDGFGRLLAPFDSNDSCPYPFDVEESDQGIPAGTPFLVPLRHGGAALCHWVATETPGQIVLHYQVSLDRAQLVRTPIPTVEHDDQGISLHFPLGTRVRAVSRREDDSGPAKSIPVQGHLARDADWDPTRESVYEVQAMDAMGRTLLTSVVHVPALRAELKIGSAVVSRGDSYSFELERQTSGTDGDVSFSPREQECAVWARGGEIQRLDRLLSDASAGERSLALKTLQQWQGRGLPVHSLATAVVGGDPSSWVMARQVVAKASIPATCVILLTTRRGAWVRLSLTEIGENHVGFDYVLNAKAPVFSSEASWPLEVNGLRLGPITLWPSIERPLSSAIVHPWPSKLDEFLTEAAVRSQQWRRQRGGHVLALVERHHARSLCSEGHVAKAASEFQLRGDGAQTLQSHNPDVAFSRGEFHARTVTDDLSSLWDLGLRTFEEVRVTQPSEWPERVERAQAKPGHHYLLHTVDSSHDHWIQFEVLEVHPHECVWIRWDVVADPSDVDWIERLAQRELKKPSIRIQVRNGKGNNAHRAHAHGQVGAFVDRVVQSPLEMTEPMSLADDSCAYIEGGFLPDDRAFSIREIEYRVDIAARGRGKGHCRIVVLGETLLDLQETDGWQEGTWEGTLILTPRREPEIFVSVGELSRCDVVLRGKWIEPDAIPSRPSGGPLPLRRPKLVDGTNSLSPLSGGSILLQSHHGGQGDRRRVFMDGSTSRSARRSAVPLDPRAPFDSETPWLFYVESGRLPENKKWMLRRIELVASTLNGGEVRVVVDGRTVIEVSEGEPLGKITWEGQIVLTRGCESSVYLEVGRETKASVSLRGELVTD